MEENTQNNMENTSAEKVNTAPDSQNKLSMPVAIIIAGIIIAFGIIASGRMGNIKLGNKGKINVKDPGESRMIEPVKKDEHIYGDLSKAKVAIVEFSDLECPYCKQIHPMLKEVTTAYGGDVVWVYRHFPLESIHARARISAHGSECVAEIAGNEGFWKFIDGIFNHNTSDNPLVDENLTKLAVASGVSAEEFNNCQTSGKYNEKIDSTITDAENAGAEGTPDVTVINLKSGEAIHVGANPQMLGKVLDQMLK
jgi:protein-disulfide isomerase